MIRALVAGDVGASEADGLKAVCARDLGSLGRSRRSFASLFAGSASFISMSSEAFSEAVVGVYAVAWSYSCCCGVAAGYHVSDHDTIDTGTRTYKSRCRPAPHWVGSSEYNTPRPL